MHAYCWLGSSAVLGRRPADFQSFSIPPTATRTEALFSNWLASWTPTISSTAQGADKQENHFGTLIEDVLPGLLGYFNARYPNKFKGGDKVLPANADTDDYNLDFGAKYDASILRNIPVILELPGHSTVGIGFDDGFARETKSHYRLNDPWDARANITTAQVGKGRPIAARGVFGSEVEDLFGPGADSEYDESASGPSPSGLPFAMHWVEPLEDADVPEPSSACLAFAAAASALLSRAARTTKRH